MLVAVLVLGVALGTIMTLFSGALRSASISEEYSRAVLLARKGIEETMLLGELVPGTETGSFESGYEWERTITPLPLYGEDEAGYSEESLPFNLYGVEMRVTWRSGVKERAAVIRSEVLVGEDELIEG